jgi:hypothetical protein
LKSSVFVTAPKKEKDQPAREDEDAMFRRGHPAGQIQQARGKHSADRLGGAQRSLLAHQQHDEHGRRRDDVSLGQALEQRQLQHPPPQRMEMEEDEAGTFGIAEGAPFEYAGRKNRQSEYDKRDRCGKPGWQPHPANRKELCRL